MPKSKAKCNKKHRNYIIRQAKYTKKDEFYTQLHDIEKELKNYRKYFENKVIYCNCDNPKFSNFFHYFFTNFHFLKLKKVIATNYRNPQSPLFAYMDYQPSPTYLEYNGNPLNISKDELLRTRLKQMKDSGDFRSEECIKILKGCDIVVTNPPFSLFIDFVDHLMKYNKDFIIIGNKQAITYENIFDFFLKKKLFFGTAFPRSFTFEIPKRYPQKSANILKLEGGKKMIKLNFIRWYTTFELPNSYPPPMELDQIYSPEAYPRYDNLPIINVDRTSKIPNDYLDKMGVPSTFMDRYNPSQFELLKIFRNPIINNEIKFTRIIIRRIGG